jgi:ribonucleotide monophosphatase NagD (HAD superfamily)
MQRLGTSPAETLAVGDRLDTDILGGQRAGCPTVLVLSGVSSPGRSAGLAAAARPDSANLADLLPCFVRKNRYDQTFNLRS